MTTTQLFGPLVDSPVSVALFRNPKRAGVQLIHDLIDGFADFRAGTRGRDICTLLERLFDS